MPERELKQQTSHPDSPDKKVGRVDMDDATPAWAKAMMKKMDGLEGKIDGMAKTAEDAVAIATEAKQQIDEVSKTIVKKEEIQRMIEDTVTKKMHAPGTAAAAHRGKPDDTDAEKKVRTITYGEFDEDTKNDEITILLNTKIETVKESVDEVFAFGKKWATRGAVRFKTEDAMWSYLKSEESEANFKYKGKTIYVNRSVRGSSEEEARTKAVRKLVRAIIEVTDGEAAATKAQIDANYKKGVVRFKDIRVGEYVDGKMQLRGEAQLIQAHFDKLME